VTIAQFWPLAGVAVIVLALAVRLFWRRGKSPWDV
jgi:hypothetical protein